MTTLGRRAFVAAIALTGPLSRIASGAQSFTVDDFLALSSRLTGLTNLDRAMAGIYLENFLAAPGITASRLAQPDAALERDIIVAWYTGVHQVRGEAQLVTYAGALQWRALGMPAAGTCVGPFGTWAKPHRPAQL